MDNRAWAFVGDTGGNTVPDTPAGSPVGPPYYFGHKVVVVVVVDMAALGIQDLRGMAGDASDSSDPSVVHHYYVGLDCMAAVVGEDTCSYSFD